MNRNAKISTVTGTVLLSSALLVAACGSDTSAASDTSKNANNVNDLQGQQQTLTIGGYNAVKSLPAYQYVAPKNPLELSNLKERLARFSDPSKIGYMYVFIPGTNMVFFSTIKGKPSSMGSSMTSPVGVYKDRGSDGGGNATVPVPGDDLSFGPEECEANGVFWFDTSNVIHEWCDPTWTYMDAPLNLPASVIQLAMPAGAAPSTTNKTP